MVLACLELQKRVPVYHLVVKNDFSCPRSVFVVCSRQFSDFLRRRAPENFGRNSRYLRIPGNRLYLRMRGRKGADPRAPRQPKAQISNFTEVLPGFYYRPQRIMDSVPFCGFACPTLHPRKLCVFSFFLEFTKTLLLYVRIQYCADMSSVTQLQYCLHKLLLTT